MIKVLFTLTLSLAFMQLRAQSDTAVIKDIQAFQNELNAEYKNPATSPLDSVDRVRFRKHNFYPVDLSYNVRGRFKRTPDEQIFKMKTTGVRTPEYVKYGEVEFNLQGKPYKLNVYRNIALSKQEEYKDNLFLPFTDNTNGVDTYGGGRYIDLKIPTADVLVIDFNKAYNPYCAYSHKYSCPIPPAENHLDTDIKAGIKMNERHE